MHENKLAESTLPLSKSTGAQHRHQPWELILAFTIQTVSFTISFLSLNCISIEVRSVEIGFIGFAINPI